MFLNIIFVFFMIFIANKTRELEKNNNNLQIKISKLKEISKINKIELIIHQNNSYLTALYEIYFSDLKNAETPNIYSINKYIKEEQNIKLVKTNDNGE